MSLKKQTDGEKEKLREEFVKMVEDDEKLLLKLQKEEVSEKIRRRKDFVRRLELERREAALNGIVLKAQEVATLQKNQIAQEEKLAVELDLIRRQEIVDQKLRLQLRQNSHELRELESQLKAAYVKKAIAAQLAEKEANKLEEELREKRAREVIEKAVGTIEEQENALRLSEKKQKAEFRHSLQDQIIEKERLRQLEFMSFMKEKKMFDDIVKKIKDEEEKELEEQKHIQQKLKEEMQQFYAARAMWKAKERLVIQQEEEKIKQINEEKEREREKTKVESSVRKWTSNEVSENLLKNFQEKQKQREEQESIIFTLMQKEIEEKENEKAKTKLANEIAKRQEARAAYKQILAEKTQKKKKEKDLDMQFAQQMKLKIEEEDRVEKEKQEKRKQEQINNLMYNQEAMRQNVQKRAESLKLTQLLNKLEEKEEKRKAELIEQERLNILKEHAPKLLGYFPKGCLTTKDLDLLGLSANSPLLESCSFQDKQSAN